jgi:DNA replication protein DnaC
MRMIPAAFGGVKAVAVGLAPCDCEGAVEARRAAEEAEEAEKRAKEEAAEARLLDKAGIPPRYRRHSHPYAAKMADMARNGQSFYIHGPNGTRKTTLAMAVGNILAHKGVSVCALATYDLMDAMRSRKDEDRALFERAASCDVLILDDLGKEASNTAYACERLFAIIDKRDKAEKPTIITTNYKLSEIAKKITEGAVGVAIASRLRGSCKQVPLEGEDWRLKDGQD